MADTLTEEMMTIEFVQTATRAGKVFEPGMLLDVSAPVAAALIAAGLAEMPRMKVGTAIPGPMIEEVGEVELPDDDES